MGRRTLRQRASGLGVFVAVAISSVGVASAQNRSSDRLCVNLTIARCNQYKADLAAYTIAFARWNKSVESIDDTYQQALEDAQSARVKSFADADALPSRMRTPLRLAATRVYAAAIRTAASERFTALQTLGSAPKRPVRP